jgi:hypothetical protein
MNDCNNSGDIRGTIFVGAKPSPASAERSVAIPFRGDLHFFPQRGNERFKIVAIENGWP